MQHRLSRRSCGPLEDSPSKAGSRRAETRLLNRHGIRMKPRAEIVQAKRNSKNLEALSNQIARRDTSSTRTRLPELLLMDRITPTIPMDVRILFFVRDRAEFGFLSHFHPAVITLDGLEWPSVEHYYQAQKSQDPRYVAAIRAAVHPSEAKRLAASPDTRGRAGRNSWFRANGRAPRSDWIEIKRDVMRIADFAKFSQNAELQRLLLLTDDAEIVEDSPRDAFWGIGPNGRGENWAGRILMEVRSRLRSHSSTALGDP